MKFSVDGTELVGVGRDGVRGWQSERGIVDMDVGIVDGESDDIMGRIACISGGEGDDDWGGELKDRWPLF